MRDPSHTVAGLDGCRGGWVLATLGLAPSGRRRSVELTIEVVGTFAAAVARVEAGALEQLAVDMPIGLPEGGADGAARAADGQARARLGRRRSSVFPTPVRATLGSADYAEALARSRRACGVGLSKQAFNLLGAMAEVDRAMTPARQDRIFECHPELAFAELAGGPLAHAKHTAAGIDERVGWLRRDLAAPAVAALVEALARRPAGAGADDLVDAVVIALVARAVAADDPTVVRLGDGSRDRRGLVMEIVTRSPGPNSEVPCSD